MSGSDDGRNALRNLRDPCRRRSCLGVGTRNGENHARAPSRSQGSSSMSLVQGYPLPQRQPHHLGGRKSSCVSLPSPSPPWHLPANLCSKKSSSPLARPKAFQKMRNLMSCIPPTQALRNSPLFHGIQIPRRKLLRTLCQTHLSGQSNTACVDLEHSFLFVIYSY